MRKLLLLPFLLLALTFSSAGATTVDPTGKVASIEGNQVTVEVTGEMPSWARKGGYVKATGADGKLVLRGGKVIKVEGNIITLTSAQAKSLKVGVVYKLAKARVTEGC